MQIFSEPQGGETPRSAIQNRASVAGWQGHSGIIGQPGVGKSYLLKRIVEGRNRCLVFDTVWQYGTGPRQNPLPGFFVLHTLPGLVKHLRDHLFAGFRVIYQPEYDPEDHFLHICRLIKAVRDCTFAIDEVQEVSPQSAGAMQRDFRHLALIGRHPNVTLVWTSQRPAQVPTGLRSVTQNFKVFRLEDKSDTDWARSVMPRDILQQVPMLRNRFYFARDSSRAWQLCYSK